jgi:hypothetical protein
LLFVVNVTEVIAIAGMNAAALPGATQFARQEKDICALAARADSIAFVKTATLKKNLTHHTSILSPISVFRKPQNFGASKSQSILDRGLCRICRHHLEWFRPVGSRDFPKRE